MFIILEWIVISGLIALTYVEVTYQSFLKTWWRFFNFRIYCWEDK
jgi:hypothetical protein